MSNFSLSPTPLPGVLLIETRLYEDDRGSFMETYHRADLAALGLDLTFVQDNQSSSKRGVVRGLHFQVRYPQGKLVRVLHGEIYDVVVDLRSGSPTYGRSSGALLSSANRSHLYVPPGFAHGFMALSETADVLYKCTDYYRPADEGGIFWNDPDLGIDWPLERIERPLLSKKDEILPRLRDLKQNES